MRVSKFFAVAVIAAMLFVMPTSAIAQKGSGATGGQSGYKTGIGLRLGYESGITFKHFIKEHRALEGILTRGWGYGGGRITGLYEIHKPLPGAPGFDWFFGFGAHIGSFDGRYYGYYGYYNGGYYDKHGKWHPTGYRDYYLSVGIDGILGIEYQLAEIPLTLGIDIKPWIDFYGRGSHFGDGGLSIRYIF